MAPRVGDDPAVVVGCCPLGCALLVLLLPELRHVRRVISAAEVATRLLRRMAAADPQDMLCGYNADAAGDATVHRLTRTHRSVGWLRPEGTKGWNELLQAVQCRPQDGTGTNTGPRSG